VNQTSKSKQPEKVKVESLVESETSSHASDAEEPDDEYLCDSSGDEAKITEKANATVKK
jgi:hypothetical protein